jgi:hypothetical protein
MHWTDGYYPNATRVLPTVVPQPDPLRQKALEMAIGCHHKEACSLEGILHNAEAFYKFLKGS